MMDYEKLFEASFFNEGNDTWTKDTLANLPVCRGILLFTDSDGLPIQLLQAANLRRTAQARLIQDENEPPRRKADVSHLTRRVYYTCCYNHFLTQLRYIQLAHAVYGKATSEWIQLPKVTLSVIDTDAELPFFYAAEGSSSNPHKTRFGLFSTRKAASEFCEFLNAVFVLCRNPSLPGSGKEQSCSYLQMKTCPGPCLNSDIRDEYASSVKLAIQTAGGEIESPKQQLSQCMQQASEVMNFETAQYYKTKLQQLNKLERPDFRHVHPLDDLCFLHIDAGDKIKVDGKKKKQQQLMWFKVTPNGIYHLGNFVPETNSSIAEFLEENWILNKNPLPLKNSNEVLALLSLQLFRSQRSGIWIDCTNGIWKDDVIKRLYRCFGIELSRE